MYVVYEHKNKINNKRYIGVTGKTVEVRWSKKEGSYKASRRFHRALMKYGWDNFEHNILYTCDNKEEAFKKEIELIAEYKTIDSNFGYNAHIGGNAGFKNQKHTDATKLKISERVKNAMAKPEVKKKHSESIRAAYANDPTYRKRVARKSISNYFLHTEETKQKISNALTGRKRSEEIKQKISNTVRGKKRKPLTEITKQKLSEKKKEYWLNKKREVAPIA